MVVGVKDENQRLNYRGMIGVDANCDKLPSHSKTGVKIPHCIATSPEWMVTQMAKLYKGIHVYRI